MAFRWMDLSDWLAYRLMVPSSFMNGGSILFFFPCFSRKEMFKPDQLTIISLIHCSGQLVMIHVVYVQQFASGHILDMRIWNKLMRIILEIWKHVDGMMPFGRKLA